LNLGTYGEVFYFLFLCVVVETPVNDIQRTLQDKEMVCMIEAKLPNDYFKISICP
jgi:hypothetical protein